MRVLYFTALLLVAAALLAEEPIGLKQGLKPVIVEAAPSPAGIGRIGPAPALSAMITHIVGDRSYLVTWPQGEIINDGNAPADYILRGFAPDVALIRSTSTTIGAVGDLVPTVGQYRITGKYFRTDAQGERQSIAILEEVQRPIPKLRTGRRSGLHKTLRR